LCQQSYNAFRADVWSLGILAHQLLVVDARGASVHPFCIGAAYVESHYDTPPPEARRLELANTLTELATTLHPPSRFWTLPLYPHQPLSSDGCPPFALSREPFYPGSDCYILSELLKIDPRTRRLVASQRATLMVWDITLPVPVPSPVCDQQAL
jgi:hypothetical protein